MSDPKESDEIPVKIEIQDDSDNAKESDESEITVDELKSMLEEQRQKAKEFEDKYKRALADFQNLERKTQSDIENGVNSKIDKFMLNFLSIYDDFVRAKDAFANANVDTKGLEFILNNMDSLLKKFDVTPIDALGEVFDPKLHEAISVKQDPQLDDDTITKEIRKGYISHNRVIRPTLVEISKKS